MVASQFRHGNQDYSDRNNERHHVITASIYLTHQHRSYPLSIRVTKLNNVLLLVASKSSPLATSWSSINGQGDRRALASYSVAWRRLTGWIRTLTFLYRERWLILARYWVKSTSLYKVLFCDFGQNCILYFENDIVLQRVSSRWTVDIARFNKSLTVDCSFLLEQSLFRMKRASLCKCRSIKSLVDTHPRLSIYLS